MWWNNTYDKFRYISEKILDSKIDDYPFKHVLIEDFLSEEHLDIVLNDSQVHLRIIMKFKLFQDVLPIQWSI